MLRNILAANDDHGVSYPTELVSMTLDADNYKEAKDQKQLCNLAVLWNILAVKNI